MALVSEHTITCTGSRNCYEYVNTGVMFIDTLFLTGGAAVGFPTTRYYVMGFSFSIPSERYRTIKSAKLIITPFLVTGNPSFQIYVESSDNAEEYGTSIKNLTGRTYTDSGASIGDFSNGVASTSEDFSSTLQSVINRSGWEKDNYIGIELTPKVSLPGNLINVIATGTGAVLLLELEEYPAWDAISTQTAKWDPSSVQTAKWDYSGRVCIAVGYGVGAYGNSPGGYGYGTGGLSCSVPGKWDSVSTQTAKWDSVSTQTAKWDEV